MKSPTDEIRAIRHALAAKFDNDVDRIYEDLVRRQNESGRIYVSLPRRVPEGSSLPSPASGAEQLSGQSLPPSNSTAR